MSSIKVKKNYNISISLKKLRQIYSITAEELAAKLKIDITSIRGYELRGLIPSFSRILKITKYFGISIDFFLLGNETSYTHSIKLLQLAEIIDKLGVNERYKAEASASALIKPGKNPKITIDNKINNLTTSFHNNLKILRESKNISQSKIAEVVKTSRVQVSSYEKKSYPRIDKIIKLSDFFSISIHYLLTGEPLSYSFKNTSFENTILVADKILSFKEIDFLIHLMQRIIEDTEQ